MSTQCGKVISLILLERFGEIVETVGTYLFRHGSSPLLYIKKNTNLPLSKVKPFYKDKNKIYNIFFYR